MRTLVLAVAAASYFLPAPAPAQSTAQYAALALSPSASEPPLALRLAPELFAGLHEAASLPWRAWRFRIRLGAACGATSPDCARCWTGRYRRALTASGRSPIASVKRSISAKWPRPVAAHRELLRGVGRPRGGGPRLAACRGSAALAAVCGAPRALPHTGGSRTADVPGTVGEVRDLALVRVGVRRAAELGLEHAVGRTIREHPRGAGLLCRPSTAVSGGLRAWLAGRGRVCGVCAAPAGPRRLDRLGRRAPAHPRCTGCWDCASCWCAPASTCRNLALPRAGPGRSGRIRRRLRAPLPGYRPWLLGDVPRRDRTERGRACGRRTGCAWVRPAGAGARTARTRRRKRVRRCICTRWSRGGAISSRRRCRAWRRWRSAIRARRRAPGRGHAVRRGAAGRRAAERAFWS